MKPMTSRKKAHTISTALVLVGLALLVFTDAWWPGIMLVIGLPLALRQYLLGRSYDMVVTLVVFVGTFVTVEYEISWRVFLPILFSLGAIYILVREFSEKDMKDEAENEEDLNREIKENKKH